MRILHVMTDLNIGGAELAMRRLIESHLDDPSFDHSVISLRTVGTVGQMLRSQGIRVEALHLNSPFALPLIFCRLASLIRHFEPDIVQTWMYHSDLLGGVAARLAGCSRVLWGVRVANMSVGVAATTRLVRWICARLSRRVPDKIIYVAQTARRVHEQLGYDASKGVVITNGFRVTAAALRKAQLRDELGLGSDTVLIGSAGRYNPQKDHRSFIRACAEIAHSFPNAHFIMLGRNIDQANRELARWIAESGCSDRFHLLGERRDIALCLADLNLFCLHSIYEGLPNVVGEAMAAGIPCVVTDAGDAALIVGDTGIVVPPADPSALASAIREMLSKPKEQLDQLGCRARDRVATHFSMDAARLKFEQLYHCIVQKSASRPILAGVGPEVAPADCQRSIQEQ